VRVVAEAVNEDEPIDLRVDEANLGPMLQFYLRTVFTEAALCIFEVIFSSL
jgi:hypothetical protein